MYRESPVWGAGGERDGGGGGRVDVREFGLGDLGGQEVLICGEERTGRTRGQVLEVLWA